MRCFEACIHAAECPSHPVTAGRGDRWKALAITASFVMLFAFGCGGRGSLRGPVGTGGVSGTADGGAEDVHASVGCAKQLASGADHACVLYADGRISCFGGGGFGQLGNGGLADAPAPVRVEGIVAARLVAAGGHHTCALGDGGLQCWGDNRSSELGVAGMEQSPVPVFVRLPAERPLLQLALGSRHGCVLDDVVHGYCWGTGAGAVAIPTAEQIAAIGLAPRQILQLGGSATRLIDQGQLYEVPWQPGAGEVSAIAGAPTRIIANAIGDDHDCVLKTGGTVWCRGTGHPDLYAVVADFGNDVVEVAVGDDLTCVRTESGQVLCRGRNDLGQLGDGTLASRTVAATVPGIAHAVELSLGAAHACARLDDGSVWCWGALGGSGVRKAPERIAGPAPSQTCQDVTSVPRPSGLPVPEATAADKLTDATLAWAQNQCRCGVSDVNPGCIQDETPLLNGCLAALGPGNEAQERCIAEAAWRGATCAVKCVDSPSLSILSECARDSVANCGATNGALAFCGRRTLPCDHGASMLVQAAQTCDGKNDCPNGFDEANCRADSTAFHCADGFSTVGLAVIKNGAPDCPDGSDEW